MSTANFHGHGMCPESILDLIRYIIQCAITTKQVLADWWLQSDGGRREITRVCVDGVSLILENEGDIKSLRGENYYVDCCSQIPEYEGSMSLASGMCSESILDCDWMYN